MQNLKADSADPVTSPQASRWARFRKAPQRSWQFRRRAVERELTRASQYWGRLRGNRLWQRALVNYGRSRGLTERDNFLVLSAARSGSSLFVDYLNCHRQIRCRGEILNRDYKFYGDPRALDATRLKLHVEAFYLKRQCMLAGAKILTYQLDELPIKIADLLDVLHQPRVIVLYRQSTLEQYASLKLAERNRVWHVNAPRRLAPTALDPADFVAFALRERRMWHENLTMLGSTATHFVSYEQLSTECDATMRRVFGFLGLPSCTVDSPLVKLNPQPPAEKIANFREFQSAAVRQVASLDLMAQASCPLAA